MILTDKMEQLPQFGLLEVQKSSSSQERRTFNILFSYTLERKQRKKSLSHRFTESKYAADTVYHVKCISECDNIKNQRPARESYRRGKEASPDPHKEFKTNARKKTSTQMMGAVPSLSVGRIYFFASPHRSRHLVSCARSRLHS